MKIEVERDALVAALRQVVDVVASKNTIPVLGNLLLVAKDGELSVTGTDLDLMATARVPAAGELSITVDKAKLVAAAQSLKPGKLVIEPVPQSLRLTVKQGRAQRTLPTLPSSDFPQRDPINDGVRFTILAPSLVRLLGATHPAMSSEETRYYLCGVFLHVVDDQLRAAATDGHKLIRAHAPAPEGAESMAGIIVPDKTVTLLRKLLDKAEGDVEVCVTKGGTAISVELKSVRILSKLVEGTYPDYQRIIPQPGKQKLKIARDALIEPLNAVAAVLNAEGDKVKTKGVVFELKEGDEGTEVSGKDGSGTTSVEPLDGDYSGDPIRFGLNSRYGAMTAGIFAESTQLTLSTNGPRDPILIQSDKDPDLVAVIMPMNA